MGVTPEELSELIGKALAEAREDGRISLEGDLPAPKVERPRSREHRDWTTNMAMQLAKRAGMAPRDLAGIVKAILETKDGIEAVEVAGPGFINIRLSAGAAGELARTILEQGMPTAVRPLAQVAR